MSVDVRFIVGEERLTVPFRVRIAASKNELERIRLEGKRRFTVVARLERSTVGRDWLPQAGSGTLVGRIEITLTGLYPNEPAGEKYDREAATS